MCTKAMAVPQYLQVRGQCSLLYGLHHPRFGYHARHRACTEMILSNLLSSACVTWLMASWRAQMEVATSPFCGWLHGKPYKFVANAIQRVLPATFDHSACPRHAAVCITIVCCDIFCVALYCCCRRPQCFHLQHALQSTVLSHSGTAVRLGYWAASRDHRSAVLAGKH